MRYRTLLFLFILIQFELNGSGIPTDTIPSRDNSQEISDSILINDLAFFFIDNKESLPNFDNVKYVEIMYGSFFQLKITDTLNWQIGTSIFFDELSKLNLDRLVLHNENLLDFLYDQSKIDTLEIVTCNPELISIYNSFQAYENIHAIAFKCDSKTIKFNDLPKNFVRINSKKEALICCEIEGINGVDHLYFNINCSNKYFCQNFYNSIPSIIKDAYHIKFTEIECIQF